MTEHDERFLPELVDEQIEHIEQSTQQKPVSWLVHDLRIVSQDSTEICDRVWDRLLDHMEQIQLPPTEAQQRLNERIHSMPIPQLQPVYPVQQPKPRQRFTSWLTLVAAIIIAILVAGSSAAVFHYAHSQQPHTTIVGASAKSHVTSTSRTTPAVTPLPANICKGDGGWETICTTNQQTTIDQLGKLQGSSIHLYAGYADSNRIILAYTIQLNKSNLNQMRPLTLTLSAQKGVKISPDATGGGFLDSKTMQDYDLYSVPLLSVANTITTLHVHADMAFLPSAGKASFEFSLPFHRGHNVTINQTQIVNGQPITLDHVSTSATQTVIYVRGPQINTGMEFINVPDPLTSPAYELHIGNWSSLDKTAITNDTWSENDDKHLPPEGIKLIVNYPLLNNTGVWTLLIHHEAIPGATSDVVFHFKN